MPSGTNTTVTFSADQLETIESLGNKAAQELAGTPQGQSPPVGIWAPMYNYILTVMTQEGIQGGQAYWFQEAGAINADDLSNPGGFFVRDITAIGLDVPVTDQSLQGVSDAIGQNIFLTIEGNVINGTSGLSFNQQLQDDIGTAINTYHLPIGSWGGSFYFWNFPYLQDSTITVGDSIEADSQQTQTFITNTAQAMADTIEKFGMSTLENQQASRAAFAQGFDNLISDNLQAWGIGYRLLQQLATDVGQDTAQQFMNWLNFGWMTEVFVTTGSESVTAGNGSDVLFGGQGLGEVAGNDTLVGGGGQDSFVFALPTSGAVTETISDPRGNGAVAVLDGSGNISLLGGTESQPLSAVAGETDVWSDNQGTDYTFDPTSGDLDISGGLLTGGNEIVIENFSLAAATEAATGSEGGELGFHLTDGITLTAGTTGANPSAPNFVAGSTQSYTVSVDAPATSAQVVTITVTGAPAGDFGLVAGTSVVPINGDGTFNVAIAAGQTSASFSLVNIGDVGAAANLQLTASVSDPTDQNNTISSTPLTQNYVEPAQDPFAAGIAQQLYYFGSQSVNGVSVGTYGDSPGPQDDGTPVGGVADGNEEIALNGTAGESISGGTGSDTIFGAFIQPANVNGGIGPVSVIDANGGQDIIDIGDSAYNSQEPPVRIYGNSSEDLAEAITDAEQGAPTHQQGDLISTYIDDATIVGGSGDDLIMSSSNGVIVAGPGDDTIVGGGSLSFTGNLTGATWSTDLSGDQLSIGGNAGISLATSAGSYSYSSYEGNVDSFGYALGTSNQTIFGGAGNDAVLLSNGNNAVNLGSGDSTVFGGMGNNTISGGSGNDSLVGGGGSDYIEAGSGNDFVAGYGGNNTIFGGSGTDTIYAGAAGSSWATGETGDDYVEAGSGNTLIYGSGGSDTLVGGAGTDTIDAGHGSESLVAGSGDTSIAGGSGPDTIVAGSGSDTILGSTGSTTIYGGTGVDQIAGQGGTDVIYAGDGGTSEAATSVTAGSGSTTIYGGQGVDQIWGGDGADLIYAGDGGTTEAATQVVAGSGDATIYGGDGIDHIFGGSGTDVLYAGDGGEEGNLTYVTAGTGVTTLYGGAGASVLRDDQGGSDVLEAGSGNTALYGVGQDTLIAGSGSDYLVGGPSTTYDFGPNDSLDEVASSGGGTLEFSSLVDPNDLSLSAVLDSADAGSLEIDDGDGSITLDGGLSGENIGSVDFDDPESLSLTQFIQQEASLANVTTSTLAGTNGNFIFDVGTADSLSGGTGQDTISAWGNDDTISAGPGGTDILAGGTDDLVMGGSGNDTLDAVTAGTTLVGGMGNEVFDVSDSTDVVDGQAGAASNQIYSTASYTLPTNVDVLTLTGTADLSATGNSDSANLITGNSGNDSLIAGSGSDTLVSGSGVDTLFGGSGPTTFVVNNSADVVEPAAFEGWQDTIESSVDYVLTAAVSTLDLTGSSNLSVTDDYGDASISGNSGNDTLIGGSVRDTLVAGTGADTFEAGSGNNTFVINNAADVIEVDGTEGSDTVESSVTYTLGQGLDTLELTGSSNLEGEGNADATNLIYGNSANDTLTAGSGSDTLVAGSGSDTLVAGSGTDVLEGRAGATTYLFDAGFGQTEIEPGTGVGTVEFGAGITPSDLTVGLTTDSNGNPALLIQDGNSAVTVDGGLAGSIGAFDFMDGTQLSLAGLLGAATVIPGSLAGDNGNAVLNTSAAASLSGGYGADTILGTGASDTLTAGTGNQYLLGAGDADSITGAFGNDTLVAGGANDSVVAGNGAQVLYALGTGDVLTGGIGDDTLYGGAGADTLVSGTGGTVIYGGNSGDSVVLTQGANVTFHPSGTGGVEFIELPNQMTLADFTSYQGAGGDLILQSLTGDTTAVIKGFYKSSENGKTWLIADSTGAVQPLSNWLDANSQLPSGYQAEIQGLEQAYAASLPAILSQVGEQGGTIANPGTVITQTPQYIYTFDGVTTDDVTVQGGALNVGDSENDQSTFHSIITGSTSYTETVGDYEEVTIPGAISFVPNSSLDGLDQSNLQNEVGSSGGGSVEPGTDGNGVAGYWVTLLPSTQYELVSEHTIVETVPTYTNYQDETQGFTAYNITGDGGNDVITAQGPFVGTVMTGNGNVSLNLGMEGYFYDYPNEPPLGSFIEAGNGNDTLIGSGGSDTIAAGTGYDYIQAGFGSTVYVPLEGASTEEIDVLPPLYGSGPLPHSTLVLPDGVTPEDLQYRLIRSGSTSPNNSGETAETLQISYGNSTVLVDFTAGPPPNTGNIQNVPSDDWNGIDQFQFADGTVLTRDQILALAGPAISASDFNPTVTALNPTVSADSSIGADALFSGSDSSGQSITWYQVSNDGTGGGYFTLNGVGQSPGQTFYVSAEQLPQLVYVAGAAGTSDTIQVSAFDGLVWGDSTSFDVSPAAASISQATGPNQEINGPSDGPDTIVGGYGGDTLVGASGQDTFEYNAGGGAETILETAPPTSTSSNVLQFGSGITPSSLSLSAAADLGLVLSIDGSDSVSIEGFDLLNPLQSFPIQSFAFAGEESLSLLQLLEDGAVTGGSGTITNADGSATSYQFTPSGQQIYYAQNVNSAGQMLANVSVGVDGSETTNSYTYNADGTVTVTNVATPPGGGATTTVTLYNSQEQRLSVDVTNPDGSTDNSTYAYNADGTVTVTDVATPAGGGATTTVTLYNSQEQRLSVDVTNPDGSTDNSTYAYNADGTVTVTDVATPAGGGATTTVTLYNSQEQRLSVDVTNPDGSTDNSTYAYNADGTVTLTDVATPAGGGATTTVTVFNSQQQLSRDITNPDGSTDDSTYTYNADGSITQTDVTTPAGGEGPTTTVYDFGSNGTLLNENAYTPGSNGSYTDNWTKSDGSFGSYWWNASTSEYQDSWTDSNGSTWTDDYQYAAGGSPGSTGYSFVETYGASDGSEGSRSYDASTGATTLSWDSASTGQLNGTTTDSGFYGLQDQSELTNTQADLNFFNPNVSPNFNAFLNAH